MRDPREMMELQPKLYILGMKRVSEMLNSLYTKNAIIESMENMPKSSISVTKNSVTQYPNVVKLNGSSSN